MPAYYTNPYGNYMSTMYNSYAVPQPTMPMQQSYGMPVGNSNNYMTSVDGEMAARAWQPPTMMAPNTVIPLWDLDGVHVYFKSTDAYGHMNPIRKGRVVFEDEQQNLPGNSGTYESRAENPQLRETPEPEYATKEDFEMLRKEIRSMMRANESQNSAVRPVSNQNGRRVSGGEVRGEVR